MGLRVVTAHHEAGHAVVGMHVGWHVHHLVMGVMGSGVTCMDQPVTSADWRDDVTIRLAGRAAEVRLLGSASILSSTAENERAEALATARDALGDDALAEHEVSELDGRVQDILGNRAALGRGVGHRRLPRQVRSLPKPRPGGDSAPVFDLTIVRFVRTRCHRLGRRTRLDRLRSQPSNTVGLATMSRLVGHPATARPVRACNPPP
jgi:hypothetical protein